MTSLTRCVARGLLAAAIATFHATSGATAMTVSHGIDAGNVPVAPKSLSARISELGQGFDGRVGIAVRSIDDGWSADWQAEELYPQQSVSKLWVAITALVAVDRGKITLDQPVTLTRDDLTLFHQPIAQEVLAGPFVTTIRDLIVRAITTSDNTANDKLMRVVGGPRAVRAMIRNKHLGAIRFYNGERALQSRIAGLKWNPAYSIGNAFFGARDALPFSQRKLAFDQYIADPYDGASPDAIVNALALLERGRLLSSQSSRFLLETMSHTHTGPNRLRGGLAPGWELNHKTGTGQVLGDAQAGYNDVGILTAPDGKTYAVAVMIKVTSAPLATRMNLMNEVVRAVIAAHDSQAPAPARSPA